MLAKHGTLEKLTVAMIDLETLLLPPAPLVVLGSRTPSTPCEFEKELPYTSTADSREIEATLLDRGSPKCPALWIMRLRQPHDSASTPHRDRAFMPLIRACNTMIDPSHPFDCGALPEEFPDPAVDRVRLLPREGRQRCLRRFQTQPPIGSAFSLGEGRR